MGLSKHYVLLNVAFSMMSLMFFSFVFPENEWAFDLLYCVAFVVMDKQWLDRNATYMEFNVRKPCYRFYLCSQHSYLLY